MDIQGLKNKILQLAIQGKLVEQDKNDEPASALVQRIKEERDKLVKEKKIRKQKPLPEVTDEEKPFEIPGSWEWVRLGEIIRIYSGKGLTSKNMIVEGNIPVYGGNGITGYHNDYNIEKPTIVIGRVGFYCGSIHLVTEKAWITDNAFITDYSEDNIYLNFLKYLLKGTNLRENDNATAQPVISGGKIYPIIVPLPPFAEQKRIVEKVDELFALIDELDSNKEDLLEVINLTRNQVLQQAIQGKLVEQNPEDEPASVLLDRIKEEGDRLVKEKKIRKPKKLPPIEEEEKPFEIPKGWEWVRLGQVLYNIHYGYTASAKDVDTGVKMLRITDIQDGKVIWENVPYCEIEDSKIKNYKLKYGDILIARTGGTIGKSFLVTDLTSTSVFASYLIRIELSAKMSYKYISYFLDSNLYWEQLQDKSKGTGQPNVNTVSLSNLLVPLPPFAEQKRIVEKVDMIMDMLDELEKELIINI